jgi:hypothetical protein
MQFCIEALDPIEQGVCQLDGRQFPTANSFGCFRRGQPV